MLLPFTPHVFYFEVPCPIDERVKYQLIEAVRKIENIVVYVEIYLTFFFSRASIEYLLIILLIYTQETHWSYSKTTSSSMTRKVWITSRIFSRRTGRQSDGSPPHLVLHRYYSQFLLMVYLDVKKFYSYVSGGSPYRVESGIQIDGSAVNRL